MDVQNVKQLQSEVGELLRKQREVLESRMLGTASESDLLEYEIRQEIVREMCNQLVRAISG
jgi:hypothetical protein